MKNLTIEVSEVQYEDLPGLHIKAGNSNFYVLKGNPDTGVFLCCSLDPNAQGAATDDPQIFFEGLKSFFHFAENSPHQN